MAYRLLILLFFVLFASRTLGFDLSLAPGMSVKNLFLYLVFAVIAIETALTRNRKLELMSVLVPFFIFALYAIFSWLVLILLVQYPNYSIRLSLISLKSGPIETLMVLILFFYGARDTTQALSVLRSMVWLIIAGNVVTVIDGANIVNLGLISLREDGRVGGTIGNSNEFAYFVALFLPTIIAFYWHDKGARKVLAGIGVIFSGLAFLMAVSRGAIVGLVVGALLGAWYLRAIIPTQVLVRSGLSALGLCVVAVIGAFAIGYGELLAERFGQFGEGRQVASSGRTVIWGKALGSMLENPLTFIVGYGWHAYESAVEFNFATHNYYLNILYNLGMVGVGLFLLVAVNVLRAARSAVNVADDEVRPFLIAFLFGFLSLLVAIFFGGLYTSAIYIWAFVGISLRLAVLQSEVAASPERDESVSYKPKSRQTAGAGIR